MSLIDWLIIAGILVFITRTAMTSRKYATSVADFLAANRCAGKYLLATAEGSAAVGTISVIAMFEVYYQVGFTQIYWDQILAPVALFLNVVGWVIYRFRQTRALTMGQFFEMRYSRNFRVFSGFLSWSSGLLTFAIFPAVSANFFINFCGFPKYSFWIGSVEINLTLAVVMFIIMMISLCLSLLGGQIAVLVTDFWQGIFMIFVFSTIIIFLAFEFPYSHVKEALSIASLPGESLIDPFDIAAKKDFNFSYFAIIAFFNVYNRMAFQGTQGYNCSAITPHAALMSKIIGSLRGMVIFTGILLLSLAAITYMKHPAYADGAAEVSSTLQKMFPSHESMQKQLLVPMAIKQFIPIGLSGAFVAAMLCAFISCGDTYMHSWGSIFIQDVVCPLRKKPLSQEQHLRYLRFSIIGVALFSFIFSLFFPLQEYIIMFLMIAGAVYLGGAGSVIVGGLYWKRGTTSAAWAAMITGSVLSISVLVLRPLWKHIPLLVEKWGPEFPCNSMVASFWCAFSALMIYVIISLLGRKTVNMDRILNRGQYAVRDEENRATTDGKRHKIGRFWRTIGVNSIEFTKMDKGLFIYKWIEAIVTIGAALLFLLWRLSGSIPKDVWIIYWCTGFIVYCLSLTFVGGILCGVGGFVDLRKMYKLLAVKRRSKADNGRVENVASEEQTALGEESI